jgi:hypothetical protein
VTFTVVPGGPLVGETEKEEVTVKVRDVFPTLTVYEPAPIGGTSNGMEKEPRGSADPEATCLPSKETAIPPWEGPKPSPFMFTRVPGAPLLVEREAVELMVKVAVACSARTVCDPDADAGTVKVWVHDPLRESAVPTVLPSYVIFIETFGSKFVPETVTLVVLGGPLFGAREMVAGGKATVMLNCLVAVWAGVELSVTCTVKLDAPPAVGVPEMTPAFSDRPAGKGPLPVARLQV